MILIIGGTGTYFLDLQTELGPLQRVDLDTPYGAAFPIFLVNLPTPPPIAIASRHGLKRLEVSPPFVNSRANMWAAHHLGVQAIVSWNGVGAINPLLELHDMLILDGILDFTKMRPRTFDQCSVGVCQTPTERDILPHVNRAIYWLDKQYAENRRQRVIRDILYTTARATTERVFPCGVYACTEGPRLETAAEIRAFRRKGADVVGMTLVPEIFLAHKLGIAYVSLAYVTNYATGVEPVGHAPRYFGAEVARRCLQVVWSAATRLHQATTCGMVQTNHFRE